VSGATSQDYAYWYKIKDQVSNAPLRSSMGCGEGRRSTQWPASLEAIPPAPWRLPITAGSPCREVAMLLQSSRAGCACQSSSLSQEDEGGK